MKSVVALMFAAIMVAAISADEFFFDDSDDGDDFSGFRQGGLSFGPTVISGHGGQMAGGSHIIGGSQILGSSQIIGPVVDGGHMESFIHKPIISHDMGPLCDKFGGYGKVVVHKPVVAHKTVYPAMKGVSSYMGGSTYHAGGVASMDKGLYGGYTGGAMSGNTGYPATYSAGAGSMSYPGAGTVGYAGVNQYAGASGYQQVAQNYY